MSRLNRTIAFVAALSVPLALLGSPFGPAGRVDVPAAGGATVGERTDCADTSCGQAGAIVDADAWNAAAAADTPDAYWTYLRRHPAGIHAAHARFRLERLSVSPEPPLHFAAVDVVPPQSSAEAALGEADARRRPASRLPTYLLASALMDRGAASLTPADAPAASQVPATPVTAPADEGGIPDGKQPSPATASSDGAVTPSVTAGLRPGTAPSAKAPASALSYATAGRSGPRRTPGFKPHRSAPRRFKLSELIAPHGVRPVQAAGSKAVRVRPSAATARPQDGSASAGRRAASRPTVHKTRRAAGSVAPSPAGPGTARRRHARRTVPTAPAGIRERIVTQRSRQVRVAPQPNATLQVQECFWPFCPAN